MNYSKLLTLVILAIVVLGTLLIFSRKEQTVSESNLTDTTPSLTPETQNSEASKRYLEYSPATFEQSSHKKRVLFFYASWCPTCRPVDTELKSSENGIPDGTVVIRVNYNDPETDLSEKELAKKYGVTYQHTFVQIDADGNEVTKWNGGKLKELLERIK